MPTDDPHLEFGKAGHDLLVTAEKMCREKQDYFTAQDILNFNVNLRVSSRDAETVLDLLTACGYLSDGASDFDTKIYRLTPVGRQKASYQTSTGKTHLAFPDPDQGGQSWSIQNDAGQVNIHTGKGNQTSTQNNTITAAEQAEILQLLAQLTQSIENLSDGVDRRSALQIVGGVQDAAKQSQWQIAGARMMALLNILNLLTGVTADGHQTIELANQIIGRIGGG